MRLIGLYIFLILFPFFSNAQVKNISTQKVRNAFISVKDIYKETNDNKFTSIYIPKKTFEGYKFIAVKANKQHGTRVHILKEDPRKQNEQVQYSDYYKKLIVVQKGMKLDIVIPQDAKCIYILSSIDDNYYTPDIIDLYTEDSLSNSNVSEAQSSSRRAAKRDIQKFMHWNIGHFSRGKKPYSNITANNYKVKLDGFQSFINTYCADCHYLLNEYDDIFAKVDGKFISTPSVLFENRKGYKVFPRTTSSGYSEPAIFWKEGLLSYKYGVFESLKGIKNSNGTLEYGTGYCISLYDISGDTLYVMSLHAPNGIKSAEQNTLYKEIINICSKYSNCVLVGDFNRISTNSFTVLTNAGFKILNDKSITAPSKSHIVDWVLYKCKSMTLSDFRVYSEAVDSNGDLLSDHLPLSFTVTNDRK